MLTAADTERAIETCLDAEAMRSVLQQALAAQGDVDAVRISNVHRSASRHREPNPLTLCYEIDLRATDSAEARTLHYFAKLYRGGASAQARQGTPALHIAALDLLLWPWPADPGLPQLAGLLDPQRTKPFWGCAAAEVQVLRYLPERRAMLRFRHADGRALYAKTYREAHARAVHRRFAWVWDLSQREATAPRVARPLHSDDPQHTLWQQAATGTPLAQWMGAGPSAPWVLPLAHAVAAIHQAPAELARPTPRDRAHWLGEVERRRKKIGRALPALAKRADATARAIAQAALHLPAHQPTLIHGDFHPDQVWFDGERIVLFDFDEFTLGDPMEDLAEFIVKLPDSASSARLAARWLAAYAQVAPQHFCRQRLRWHMAVQQLLQASRAFVFQVADWRAEVERRLERAELLATQAEQEWAA
jgi:Ser/Thr protein kinase RdoA (MazF antagonist)